MRKEVLFFVGFLLLFSLVSASYNCSDGSVLNEDFDEIDLYKAKSINGIDLGLYYADETSATQKYSAKLLIDAKVFLLTENNPSLTVVINEASKKITLINVSDTSATLQLESSTDSFSKNEIKTISSVYLAVGDFSGVYPNESATINGIVGEKTIELTNSAPATIVTKNSKEYLLRLSSASDNNAFITVGTCTNATITNIPDVIVIASTNSSVINSSANSTLNISENITQEKLNTTINTSEILPSNTTEIIPAGIKPASGYLILIAVAIISFCIILVMYFLIRRFRNRREVE